MHTSLLTRIIDFSLQNRGTVIFAALALIAVGFVSAVNLPIDAIPDVTNVQVQINANAGALSSVETERQVTIPLQNSLFGIAGVEQVRSLSKFGLSQVTVIFNEGTDIHFARQQVQERLVQVRSDLPDAVSSLEMGPITTGLGEIFQYTLKSDSLSNLDLRTIQEWVVAPQLRSVAGIAEVNSFGGLEKQYEVVVNPARLRQYDIYLDDVIQAVSDNNVNGSGGYLIRGGEQLVVRGIGQMDNVEHIAGAVITNRSGRPIRIADVADVTIGSVVRQGAVTADGEGEIVTGIAMMRMGENARTVVKRLHTRIASVKKSLGGQVDIVPFYDRTELIDSTISTVKKNLFEGAVLVIVILFIALGNIRGAIIVAFSIPLSMLFALSLMQRFAVAGSLMSLGAIDFGLVVDGSVVMVENAISRLSALSDRASFKERYAIISSACKEVARPIFFGITIIIVVYLPILTLQGIEGKMFKPMALTVVFALAGSLLVTFILTPVLILYWVRPDRKSLQGGEAHDTRLVRWLKRKYDPILNSAILHSRKVVVGAAVSATAAICAIPFLGSEFIPRLDEGSFALQIMRLPSVSLDEAVRHSSQVEALLRKEFPDEIKTVVSKTGRPDIATDPMGVNISDVYVMLHPRRNWKRANAKDALEKEMMHVLEAVPGIAFTFSQPIELRVNELVAGVRSDIAVKIYGDDLDSLAAIAGNIEEQLNSLPGAVGFQSQQGSAIPQIEIVLDQSRLSQYGLSSRQVIQHIDALNGVEATHILEGQRNFPLVVRYPNSSKEGMQSLGNVLVKATDNQSVPLSELASIREVSGVADIIHEDGSRVQIVEGNIRDRDIGGFVNDAQQLIADRIELPVGYRLDFGGQFENMQRATQRLLIVVPGSLILIFVLLFTALGSARLASLVFTGIPLATVGGVVALAVRGMPMSISAGIGFIALFGVAVLNGLVLISHINDLRKENPDLTGALTAACMDRLRPVITTGLVASLGFLPMALSTGAGAEVQRPLATVVIGGLVTSTLLTLIVLPVLYYLISRRAMLKR